MTMRHISVVTLLANVRVKLNQNRNYMVFLLDHTDSGKIIL